jgi:sulfoxide reductase heme-binding subunit YedZ
MKDNDIRFAKFLLLVNGLVPLALLGWDAWHHHLGANPVKYALLTTGILALVFLMLTMAVTPVRKITGWNWLLFSRRTLGLYAFFYAALHFLLFFNFDRSFSVSSTLSEMLKRKFLFVCITGLLVCTYHQRCVSHGFSEHSKPDFLAVFSILARLDARNLPGSPPDTARCAG